MDKNSKNVKIMLKSYTKSKYGSALFVLRILSKWKYEIDFNEASKVLKDISRFSLFDSADEYIYETLREITKEKNIELTSNVSSIKALKFITD